MSAPVDHNDSPKEKDPQLGVRICRHTLCVCPLDIPSSAIGSPRDDRVEYSMRSSRGDPMAELRMSKGHTHSVCLQIYSPQLAPSSYSTIDVSDVKMRTVKVSNISLTATEADIQEFFSFSGNIQNIELQSSQSESSQVAYVTFKNSQGADTSILLSGSTIRDLPVTIAPVDNILLPPEVFANAEKNSTSDSTVRKAEDVVSSMLAKGFILGKDAVNKAKAFDERHHLISSASATVESIDKKIGLREKIGFGTALVNEKVKQVDEQFQVSEKTKLALAVAEQKATSAGSAIMSNQYASTGASWVSGAFNKVARAAEAVTLMTKEKLEKAVEEKKDSTYQERTEVVNDLSQLHLDEHPPVDPAVVPHDSSADKKPENI